MKMNLNSSELCPRCMKAINKQNRLITDSCGHSKCGQCFLLDKDCCSECNQPFSEFTQSVGNLSGECIIAKNNPTSTKRAYTAKLVMPSHITEVHNSEGRKLFHCTICMKSFGSRSQRYYHLSCGNESAKKFKCTHCQKSFSSHSHYKYHLESHSKNTYKCFKCKKTFTNKIVLEKHQKTHELKPVSCEECGKTYRFSESLLAHMQKHRNNLLYQCSICDKKYAVKSTLQQHMLKHQAKKHQCNLCKKSFQRNSTLKSHLKRHSKTEQFTCKACNKIFSDSAALMRHIKIHEESIRYKCRLCDITSIRKDNMLRHIRNIHEENFENCVEIITPSQSENIITSKHHKQVAVIEKESIELNIPKTVPNSSVIKCIGNVEPVQIDTIPVNIINHKEALEEVPAVQPAVIRHKKIKRKYNPIEMYRRILIPDEENDSDKYEDGNHYEMDETSERSEHEQNIGEKPLEQRVTFNTSSNFSETHWRKNYKYTYEFQDY